MWETMGVQLPPSAPLITINPLSMSNILKNNISLIDDLANKSIDVKSLPIYISVESVRGCPFSCIMCGSHDKKIQDISFELLDKVKPLFKHLDVLMIHGDGEPLISKNMDYFINASSENGFRLGFNTNAILLKPELAEKLLKTDLEFWFSMHAARNDTYRKIMGASLQDAVKNIGYIVKRSCEIDNKNNYFGLSYLVMKENIDEIEDFLYLASKIGVKNVRFMKLRSNKYIAQGRIKKDLNFRFYYLDQYNKKVVKKFLAMKPQIDAIAERLNIKVFYSKEIDIESTVHIFFHKLINFILKGKPPYLSKKRKGICLAPWAGETIISLDGTVRLCCSSNYVLGNLKKDTFEDIWNGEKIKSIRKEFKAGYFPKICDSCPGRGFDDYSGELLKQYTEKGYTH